MSDSEDEVEYEVEIFSIREYVFHITTVSFMPIERLLDLQSHGQEISGQKLWCGSLCVMEYLLGFPAFVAGEWVIFPTRRYSISLPNRPFYSFSLLQVGMLWN